MCDHTCKVFHFSVLLSKILKRDNRQKGNGRRTQIDSKRSYGIWLDELKIK
jgi:hypothetical protein